MSNPSKEVFQIYGDQADPSRSKGLMPTYNLTNTAASKPVILWEDMLLTMDVYTLPNAPSYGIIFCPQCARNGRHNALRISQENKRFEIDLDRKPLELLKRLGMTADQLAQDLGLSHVDDLNGTISTEPIRCSWEEEPDLQRSFGLGVCGWHVAIDNNVARNV